MYKIIKTIILSGLFVAASVIANPLSARSSGAAVCSPSTSGICSPSFEDEEDQEAQSCISIVAGRLATSDGSVLTSHTCDGKYRTWVSIEPASDHPAGSLHEVRKGTMKTAFPTDTTGIRVTGTIPEAPHTYKYVNTAYPCLNEHRLGIGETTFGGPDKLKSKNGIFTIEELQRIALQRCTSAREAVELMGRLAEEYGYIDGGECLTVADTKEVWFFEIVGPGAKSKGAVWVAKRVPDGEVAVSANIPRIGKLEKNNPEGFLCSSNVEKVARELGLWDGKGEFVFWKAFNCKFAKGRNFREREFYVLSTLAPSLKLSYKDAEMPFSVKPEKKICTRDVMELLRGTYEGTGMDMCRNIKIDSKDKNGKPSSEISPVANPWITTKWRRTLCQMAPGSVEFARTVSVAWCSYSTVISLNASLPEAIGGVCWFSVDNPAQSPRIPIFCGGTTLPEAFSFCGQNSYKPDCVLWQYRKANKLATLLWQENKKDFMEAVKVQDDAAFSQVSALDASSSATAPNVAAASCRNTVASSAPNAITADSLNALTTAIHRSSAAAWSELEAKYWLISGQGF